MVPTNRLIRGRAEELVQLGGNLTEQAAHTLCADLPELLGGKLREQDSSEHRHGFSVGSFGYTC